MPEPIAKDLARAATKFSEWRDRRKLGTRIPDALWDLATRLASTHGVVRTSKVLGLDYNALKRRSVAVTQESGPATEFVELTPVDSKSCGECVVEFEDGTGCCLRVRLKGCDPPDLIALGRSFWTGE